MLYVDFNKGAKSMISLETSKLDNLIDLVTKAESGSDPQSKLPTMYLFGSVVLDEGTAKNPNIEACDFQTSLSLENTTDKQSDKVVWSFDLIGASLITCPTRPGREG